MVYTNVAKYTFVDGLPSIARQSWFLVQFAAIIAWPYLETL